MKFLAQRIQCQSQDSSVHTCWNNTLHVQQSETGTVVSEQCRWHCTTPRNITVMCDYWLLRPSHQKHRLSIADWKVLSEPQRQRVRHAVFSLSCEGLAGTQQSTSTDGNPTILHHPNAGKKLGSRCRPRADRTMTQNKKRKV